MARKSSFDSVFMPLISIIRAPTDLMGRVLRGGIGTLGVGLVGVALAFAAHVVLARLIGASEYGLYAVSLAWVGIMALTAKMGLDAVVLRLVAAYAATGEWGRLLGLARLVGLRTLLAAGGVYAFLILFLALGNDVVGPPMKRALEVAGLLVPVVAVNAMLQATLRGLKHPVLAVVPEALLRPVLLVVAAFALAHLVPSSDFDVRAMLWITLSTGLVALAVNCWLCRELIGDKLRGVRAEYLGTQWTRIAAPLWLMAAMNLLLSQVDLLILGAVRDAEEAGVYAAVSRLAGMVSFALVAANTAFAPVISELHTRGNYGELRHTARGVAIAVAAFSIPVCVGLAALAEPLLGLFGEPFRSGATALRILVVGHLVNALSGPVGFLLTMTGHERFAAKVIVAATGLSILLNGFFIPIWGIDGAAAATAASMIFWNAAMLFFVLRNLRVNPTLFGRQNL